MLLQLIFDFVRYPNAESDRMAYNKIINKCINIELVDNYNVSAFSTVEYCKVNKNKKPLGKKSKAHKNESSQKVAFYILDLLEILTTFILFAIMSVTILSSFYDRHLKNLKKNKADHYKSSLELRPQRFFTIFSIKRNWYALTAPVKENVKELRFLDAFRTINLVGVFHSHCIVYSIMLPSSNPQFYENVSCFKNIRDNFVMDTMSKVVLIFPNNSVYFNLSFLELSDFF